MEQDLPPVITELSVLRTAFEGHKSAEEKWQDGIDRKLDHIDQCLDTKFADLTALIIPVRQQVQENTQTLYGIGPEKSSGLNKEVTVLKDWREIVDARYVKAVAVMLAVQFLFNAAGFFLAKEGYFSTTPEKHTISAPQIPGQPVAPQRANE